MSSLLAGYGDSSSSSDEEPRKDTEPETASRHPVGAPSDVPSRFKLSKRDRATFEADNVKELSAEDIRGNDWQENLIEDIRSRPALAQAKARTAAPDRTKVKKHHVNWLAEEARQKEHQILERNAAGRSKQRDTRQKYGW